MDDYKDHEKRARRRRSSDSENSSDSYPSSGSEDERQPSSTHEQRVEHEYPTSRTTVAAQELQRKRIAVEADLNTMLQERAQLNANIDKLQERIDALEGRAPTRHKKRQAPSTDTEAPNSSTDAQQDSHHEETTSEHKKSKLKEIADGDAEHNTSKTTQRASAKGGLGNPLFQRLLLGTLQKSKQEVEREKTDKQHQAKEDIERKTTEKIESAVLEQRQAEIASVEAKIKADKQKLQLLRISVSQKQEELSSGLWDEHEHFLRENWLITTTEPPLYFQFAKYDSKVQAELAKQSEKRASAPVAVVVKRGQR